MSTSTNTPLARRRIAVRRGVVIALVAISVLLFTVYFRESAGGALHELQDGAGAAVAPVQSIAVKAVRPFQDAWHWTSGLVDARGRAVRLAKENAILRGQLVDQEARSEERQRLNALGPVKGLSADPYRGYALVHAEIIGRSPTNWYSRAVLNVGTSDGVVDNSPVVAGAYRGAPLVGVVTTAGSGRSVVTFITDQRFEAGATVLGAGNPPGLLSTTGSGVLQLSNVPSSYPVQARRPVVTSGFGTIQLPSVYPRGLFVGQVSSVGTSTDDQYWAIQVTPAVDVRSLSDVVVMAPHGTAALRRAHG
jgi:rod shape-determining protein MreC